jgi:hypothetical protein
MSDFYGKLNMICPTVSVVPFDTGPAHPTGTIKMIGGQVLNVPLTQIPMKNPYRNSNVWRYPFNGSFSTILQTGGTVQCPILRGTGSGHVDEAWLRLKVVNNSGSSLQYLPVPAMINYHYFQTPAGATIQTQQGSQLWVHIAGDVPQEQWYMVSQALNSNSNYECGAIIPNGATVTWFVPLLGSFLSAGGFFIPATSGDMQYYVNFWSGTTTKVLGSNGYDLTVSEMSIDMKMEQLPPPLLKNLQLIYSSKRFDYIIPYFKNQPFSQQLTAGQNTLLTLSNISGDVIFIDYLIRNSYVGEDLINYQVSDSYQYQNQEGVGISSQQYLGSTFSQKIMWPQQNLGSFTYNKFIVRHVFPTIGTAPREILRKGLKLGAYPFDNHCLLSINNSAAGTNEAWTLTGSGSAPTAGDFIIGWNNPDFGGLQTISLNYADIISSAGPSYALLTAAIQALPNFNGTVAITGSWASLTFTLGGSYANQPMQTNGYNFVFFPGTMNSSGTASGGYFTCTTPGVTGIVSGNTYLIDVYAVTTGVVSILPDGSVAAYNS